MNLEKTVSIGVTTTKNSRLDFRREGDELQIRLITPDGVVADQATLTEDDVRALVKDIFPTKRKAREAKGKAGNGTPPKTRERSASPNA